MASGFCPRDAPAAGDADIPGAQGPVHWKQSGDRCRSVRSQGQDSGFVSSYGDAEEPLGAEDGSGTEHSDLRQVPDPAGHKLRDLTCETETRPAKDKAIAEIPEDALGPQAGSATRGTELPQVPDPAGHRQGEAASLLQQSEPCPRGGIAEESQDGSAARNKRERTLGGFLAPGEWIRSHPLLTLLLLILLLLLLLALGVALAVQSGSCGKTPVTPVAPVAPVLLACPKGWVGYRGVCYFFSRDHRTWDQGQARCSELGASLAVLKDEEMEFLFTFSGIIDYWVGLRRRGQGLQWVNGSSFNSSVPVQGNAECLYLAENHLGSMPCLNEMQYLCSRAQTPL